MTVPKILHFTWKDTELPRTFQFNLDAWTRLNPDWEVKLHRDTDMRETVAAAYPELLELYDGFESGIFRSDFFRYVILDMVGGIYSDLDVEPLAPIPDFLVSLDSFIAAEPEEHVDGSAGMRTPWFYVCNALMGSRPGHPFWKKLRDGAAYNRDRTVIEATGPLMMTDVFLAVPRTDRPTILHPDSWSPMTGVGTEARASEAFTSELGNHAEVVGSGCPAFCSHEWRNTYAGWKNRVRYSERHSPRERFRSWWNGVSRAIRYGPVTIWTLRQWRHPELIEAARKITAPLPEAGTQEPRPFADADLPRIFIATPVKNAAADLPRYAELIEQIDYPSHLIEIGLLVSDSEDGTEVVAGEILARWRDRFAGAHLLKQDFGFRLDAAIRYRKKYQFRRRSILATCRNALWDLAAKKADYCLFIDVDLADFSPESLRDLLAARRDIAAANCVRPDGKVFDMNSFLLRAGTSFRDLYRHGGRDGLYQPPPAHRRRYLNDLSYLRYAPLDSVGGTMLLADTKLHGAGIRFPEEPYLLHLETEGFGLMARDKGFSVAGLPGLRIVHK